MATITDDRLTAIEEGIGELRLLAESAVKLAKVGREHDETVAKRLTRIEQDLAGMRGDVDLIRNDATVLRADLHETRNDLTQIGGTHLATPARLLVIEGHQRNQEKLLRTVLGRIGVAPQDEQ